VAKRRNTLLHNLLPDRRCVGSLGGRIRPAIQNPSSLARPSLHNCSLRLYQSIASTNVRIRSATSMKQNAVQESRTAGETAATPTTRPPPPPASDADTTPADATDPSGPQGRPPHSGPTRYAASAAIPQTSRQPATPTIHQQSPPSQPDTAAQPRSTPSSRECQGSTEVTVNHQPKHCQPSPGTETSSISRRNTVLKWGGRGSNPRPTDSQFRVLVKHPNGPVNTCAATYLGLLLDRTGLIDSGRFSIIIDE
jgi:hypothetical protein